MAASNCKHSLLLVTGTGMLTGTAVQTYATSTAYQYLVTPVPGRIPRVVALPVPGVPGTGTYKHTEQGRVRRNRCTRDVAVYKRIPREGVALLATVPGTRTPTMYHHLGFRSTTAGMVSYVVSCEPPCSSK